MFLENASGCRSQHNGHEQCGRHGKTEVDIEGAVDDRILADVVKDLGAEDMNHQLESKHGRQGQGEEDEVNASVQTVLPARKRHQRRTRPDCDNVNARNTPIV